MKISDIRSKYAIAIAVSIVAAISVQNIAFTQDAPPDKAVKKAPEAAPAAVITAPATVQAPAQPVSKAAAAPAAPAKAAPAAAPAKAGGGLITAQNWTEKVGFKPDLSKVPPPGSKINKSNAKQYAHLIPSGLMKMIEKYNLELNIRQYEPYHPSLGYIEATNKYRGQPKVINIGNEYRKRGITNYTAGLPFPQPKDGVEVAWDFQNAYMGDDGDYYYDVYWISASAGVEHSEYWRWAFICRTVNRTDLDPKPAIKEFLDKNIYYTAVTFAIEPYDKKGFGAVYSRSIDPQDQQGHIYIPAMRRVLRNSFGTRGDTWNSTDQLYEDVRGFMGYPEWMQWKLIGKQTALAPQHAGIKYGKDTKSGLETEKWPHWNPKWQWEPRPVYVLEAKAKMSGYPYGRMVMFVDAEYFTMPYKEAYDKKGQLWKVIVPSNNASPDMNTKPYNYGGQWTVDLQSEHATISLPRKFISNSNLDPKMFSLTYLRNRGK